MLHFQNELNIKYLRLQFTLQLAEDGELPRNKVSAIRGGIGEMLLRINCVGNRDCEACEFREECVVQRTIYSRFDNKPAYITTGDSVGYVLECDDLRTNFRTGSKIRFDLLLFGKTIAYFGQYIQAIFSLGASGIGKNNMSFQVTSIRNKDNCELLGPYGINKSELGIGNIMDYVEQRLMEIDQARDHYRIQFESPTTIKYSGEFMQHFQVNAVLEAARRRVSIMDYFVGAPLEYVEQYSVPEVELVSEKSKTIVVPRYSTRKSQKIELKGLIGEMTIGYVPAEMLELLLACEVLHLGKSTSFGFGKVRVD